MANQNLSDIIELYLKQILEQTGQAEIRRSEVALQFNCVPSQINYVIKTRFTVPKGYIVESKRGGGGYIRIEKIEIVDDSNWLEQLATGIGKELSLEDSMAIMETLYEYQKITKQEQELLLTVFQSQIIRLPLQEANALRARMMSALLERLTYEEKE